jgi:hypothetical protein
MGYTTDFNGHLTLSKPLTEEQFKYINKFSETRRMKRDVSILMELYDGKFGYPGTSKEKNTLEEIYGKQGEYFVGGLGSYGQTNDRSILDYNSPPNQLDYNDGGEFNDRWEENNRRIKNGECQPGLWCQWIVTGDENGMVLEWDGGEKFYYYIDWLQYLINHFFTKWGVLLNGTIEWFGEERTDFGKIIVNDNVITIGNGEQVYIVDDEE